MTGAGTSRGVAERLAHLLTCSGVPSIFVHPGDGLHGFAATLTHPDLLLAISRGGETEEILHLARVAREREIPVIGLTEAADSPLAHLSTLVLHIPPHPSLGAEDYIPLSSSLAGAALGDALCAVVRLKRGFSPEAFKTLHPGGAVGKLLETRYDRRHQA